MKEDRDITTLQLSEQQCRNQLQVNNFQEKVFDSQSNLDILKYTFYRIIDVRCGLKIELTLILARYDTVEVDYLESKENISSLVENLILTNS